MRKCRIKILQTETDSNGKKTGSVKRKTEEAELTQEKCSKKI